ncbi:potassium channel family protein [Cryobacterium sp. CG_9.6]|uniref:potassium channel family protein n=1 Tax=Cryobacterium sp. CG_9.6 TaxID=2760710 RepID=UPI0024745237|nr:potassium channel family protein [Cryobacterium sp. CG_9.6]MDH6237568.1 hypothetical protein [Cryobacterium sp. CG_9.6]
MVPQNKPQGLERFRQAQYWTVLAMIVVSYVLCARQTTPEPSPVALLVQLFTVAVVLWVTHVRVRLLRVALVVLGIAVAGVAAVAILGLSGQGLALSLSVMSMGAYLIAPVAIVWHVLHRPLIDQQTLLAAISAYLLVGMFFTFVYNAISLVTSVPTFGDGQPNSLTSQLFFSFSTLTTTGYGNLVPVGSGLQTIAVFEAITGQLFLVIAVARVVSAWVPHRPGQADRKEAD